MNQVSLFDEVDAYLVKHCGDYLSAPHVRALATFLCIKIQNKDWDDSVFVPSKLVDESWIQFISVDTTVYRIFCEKFCEQYLDRKRVKNIDEDDFAERYAATYLLAKHTKTFDPTLWPIPEELFTKKKRARETFRVYVRTTASAKHCEVEKTTTIAELRKLAGITSSGYLETDGSELPERFTMEQCGAKEATVFSHHYT